MLPMIVYGNRYAVYIIQILSPTPIGEGAILIADEDS